MLGDLLVESREVRSADSVSMMEGTSGRSRGSEMVGRKGLGAGFGDSKRLDERIVSPRRIFFVIERESVIQDWIDFEQTR